MTRQKIVKMGENKSRIFNVGAPQLDDINLKLKLKKDKIIIIFHPVLNEVKNFKKHSKLVFGLI